VRVVSTELQEFKHPLAPLYRNQELPWLFVTHSGNDRGFLPFHAFSLIAQAPTT
jgi:hypothetical protein